MNRVLRSAALCFAALAPLTAIAASPSPSPSLATVLQPAPAGYAELTTAPIHGEFTSHDWATSTSGAGATVSATETENTLNRLGFVDGYGKTWSSPSLRRALIEAVMAFGGGRGAKSALTALEGTDKADPHYVHPDTITGLDDYYGAHFNANGAFEDGFVFVKGNDLFIVIFAGAQDNVLSAATDQAKAQYDSAPPATIPSSQWPENQNTNTAANAASGIAYRVVVVLIILGLGAAIVALLRRRQRRSMVPMGTYAPPPMSAPAQMSPDGNFWWDGQSWQDASLHSPPGAQRSPDGSLWWDGRAWRPIPQTQQPAS